MIGILHDFMYQHHRNSGTITSIGSCRIHVINCFPPKAMQVAATDMYFSAGIDSDFVVFEGGTRKNMGIQILGSVSVASLLQGITPSGFRKPAIAGHLACGIGSD